MSAINEPGSRAAPTKSSPTSRARAGETPAHEPDESLPEKTTVYVLSEAVVIVTPEYTKIEHPRHGTEWGAPVPESTRQALEVLAYYG